jgi:hypothetical protein
MSGDHEASDPLEDGYLEDRGAALDMRKRFRCG